MNLDLSAPIMFFNGVVLPIYQPFPGSISAPSTPPDPLVLSAQGLWLDGAAPTGFRLSQGAEIQSESPTGITSIAGPSLNDDNLSLNVVGLPHCWASSIPAFGANYTTLSIEANGRLVFGSGDSDFSPTLSEAANDAPFIGFWTDLDASQGGSITASTPAPGSGIIRVDYLGVPYFGVPSPTVSFGVEIDCIAGTLRLDGLSGIGTNPSGGSTGDSQFLGLSPGSGASDPGAQAFAVGSNGAASTAADMLYDFAQGLGSAGPTVTNALLPGTLDVLVFTPDGSGNYSWQGF